MLYSSKLGRKIFRVQFILATLAIFSFVGTSLLPQPADAAALSAGRIRMNRQKQSLTSGVEHTVAFTTSAVNGTEAKVQLRLPVGDDTLWCRTAGALTVVTSTEDGATALPGTLTAACAQTDDTITVSGVTDLATSTRYGFKVSGSTGVLGTPTTATTGLITIATRTGADADIDTQTVAVDIIADDQIAVSANVDPSITVSLDTNTANLGTLTTANVNKAAIVSTVTTNALNGFTSHALYNNTLRIDGTNDINDAAGGTIVAGTEEFGAATSEATAVDISVWSPTSCTTGAATSNATALTTAAQSFATAAAPVSSDATTLCLLASVTGTTTAGTYTNTVTLVTTAKF